MTILVQESVANNNNIAAENETAVQVKVQVRGDDLNLDGSFVVPGSNAFGHNFRDYEKESMRKAIVEEFYKKNHIYQTYEFAKKKKEHYGKLDKAVMSIWECCELLNEYVDESDPDLDDPQIKHLLQTAEAIRRDYPDQDWLHLTALIHGWLVLLMNPLCITSFSRTLKTRDTRGIYTVNCGLDNVTMSWGMWPRATTQLFHQQQYSSLSGSIPFMGTMHRSGAYTYLMNDEDKEMLKCSTGMTCTARASLRSTRKKRSPTTSPLSRSTFQRSSSGEEKENYQSL
ncbi:hypothetical protein JRO89_XS04G0218700 [Xanthoceras sorbifolium]|uniref:Inositol oxygenase n=1 Tax=Xanthoceras sorbifolium TaxID=99658 RepID=A0ABQ8I6F2_9ROSI|nr:hypothetical protein JRO89_XS04G0218700 [Xanthoceras sorbifolium]